MKYYLLWLMVVGLYGPVSAQERQELPLWVKENSTRLAALNNCSDELREAILQLSTQPLLIDGLMEEKQQALTKFKSWTRAFSAFRQSELYLLSRYPDLVRQLYLSPSATPQDLEPILSKYPQDLHGVGFLMASKKPKLNQLMLFIDENDKRLQKLLRSESPEIQNSVRLLVQHPEYLDAVLQLPEFLKSLGSWQTNFPKDLSDQLSKIGKDKERAAELQHWMQVLTKNPGAWSELQVAAKAYTYDPKEPDYRASPRSLISSFGESKPRFYFEHFYLHPSPWWFGKPSATPDVNFWYPMPHWIFRGYYTDPKSEKVLLFHLPDAQFMVKHFSSPANWEQYPHLTDALLQQWEAFPNHTVSSYVQIGQWVETNRTQLSQNWMVADASRPERIKSYARLQSAFTAQQDNQEAVATLQAVLDQNKSAYPLLSAANGSPMEQNISPGGTSETLPKFATQPKDPESAYWIALSRLQNTWK